MEPITNPVRRLIARLRRHIAPFSGQAAERRRTDIGARNDRTFLQSLIDYLPMLIYVKSIRPENFGQMIVWNKASEVITGYSAQQVIGRTGSESFPTEMAKIYDQFDQEMLNNPMVIERPEVAFLHADGRQHYQHIISVPLFDNNNQPEYILSIAEDVTQRRKQESELRTKQAELAAVNDASPLGLFHTDPNGLCTYVNRTYEEMSGLSREQALNSGWTHAIHPEDRLHLFQTWSHAARKHETYQGVHRFLHSDGRVVWISVKTAPIRVDGKVEGYVGSVDDITARRLAEQALRDSEARLRTITDALPARIAYIDANLCYRFVNRAYERDYGRTCGEMRDQPAKKVIGEAAYLRVKSYMQRVLQGETVIFEFEDEKDGAYSCSEVTYIPQYSEDGTHVVGFHSMNHDITAKKLEEKRLVQLAQIDSLTGLINRAGFEQRLTDAIAQSKASHVLMALMYLDIDHFKQINDTYGHLVGDAVIKGFVARLVRTLRATDTVARPGGDEFTVIMERLAKPEDAAIVAAKIVQTMQAPFLLEEHTLSVSVSIGLAFYRGGETDSEELIRQADNMLYTAKQAGRNTFRAGPLPPAQ